jgi:hypothetical protein
MSLTAGSLELSAALKDLRVLWEQTQTAWDDIVRHDFEANYWAPLESQLMAVLRAMDRLAPVLAQARRECSPDNIP